MFCQGIFDSGEDAYMLQKQHIPGSCIKIMLLCIQNLVEICGHFDLAVLALKIYAKIMLSNIIVKLYIHMNVCILHIHIEGIHLLSVSIIFIYKYKDLLN